MSLARTKEQHVQTRENLGESVYRFVLVCISPRLLRLSPTVARKLFRNAEIRFKQGIKECK